MTLPWTVVAAVLLGALLHVFARRGGAAAGPYARRRWPVGVG